jgi:hypothetical protein
MSETPSAADDAMKLLDRGDTLVLFRSRTGSYTAVCFRGGSPAGGAVRDVVEECLCLDEKPEGERASALDEFRTATVTDDFTPSRVLYRLSEKATTGRIVRRGES